MDLVILIGLQASGKSTFVRTRLAETHVHVSKDVIGHVHTAGNPGRAELDDTQEINFPPILRKLVSLKYAGYVGHEFIPTRDPVAGLKQAISLCDV